MDVTTTPSYNVWQDSYGIKWTLTSNNNGISGFVVVLGSTYGPGCHNVTFTVTGWILPSTQIDGLEGTTSFSWTGSNPVPSAACGTGTPISSTYTGQIQNDGNDYAVAASWQNVDGKNGSTNVQKQPYDLPTSETTTAVGFGGSGVYLTIAQFRQSLNGPSGNTDIFKGRQVFEYTGLGGYDNCYQTWSAYPAWKTVDGSRWNVGYYPVDPPWISSLNTWADDYIGYPANLVAYHRSHYHGSGVLCGARIPQVMNIEWLGYAPQNGGATYAYNTVGEDIYTSSVTAYRAGVSQSANH